MDRMDVVALATELVRMDTRNPPGNEEPCARFLGRMFSEAGCEVRYHELAPGRAGLVATLRGVLGGEPLCFSGHLDTVPEGNADWTLDPLSGLVSDGRLHGRGSTDMKGGVAAMVAAVVDAAREGGGRAPGGDVVVLLSADEENGCNGAARMAGDGVLPDKAGALLVAEPTANVPALGHKGVLWLECTAAGKSAHAAMPEQGENAVLKAARAMQTAVDATGALGAHPVLGPATCSPGLFCGGNKINVVPDEAVFHLDIRSAPGQDTEMVRARTLEALGHGGRLRVLSEGDGVFTSADTPWMREVAETAAAVLGEKQPAVTLAYFTDAAYLAPAMGHPPTCILGPGEPDQLHQTDEFCRVDRLVEARDIYGELIRRWKG